jgi:Ca-activated chloride channel family protein
MTTLFQRSLVFLIALTLLGLLALGACNVVDPRVKDDDGTDAPPDTTTNQVGETEIDEESVVVTGSRIAREHAPLADQMLGGIMPAYAPEPFAPPPILGPNREQYEDSEPGRFLLVGEDPVSTFSADVDTASYSNMRRMLEDGQLPPRGALRTEELINYFSYGYAYPEDREAPFAPTVWVTPTPWNPDTQLMHVGIRGFDDLEAEPPLLNLVFLIDVSGSMGSADKLPLVQQSLRMLVNEMRPEDRIGIVVYAGSSGVLLQPTDARNRGEIHAAIDGLTSGGSTAGAEGLRTAYALAEAGFDETRVNRVIMASDGDFNVGTVDADSLRDFIARKRDTGVYFTYLGFGTGNYSDVRAQSLAQAGNGNAAYIDGLTEARKVLVDEMRATLFPIANDVKFQVEFNPGAVAEYRLIGYETRMLNREDFSNDEVDAGDIGAGHTVTAIYEIVPVGSSAMHYEPLRYQEATTDADGEELAFLRMRYKLPGDDESNLIERPIRVDEALSSIDEATEDARFAAAVAALGQYLRNDPYLPDYELSDIRALAQSGRGEDDRGLRAEFIQLLDLTAALESGKAG